MHTLHATYPFCNCNLHYVTNHKDPYGHQHIVTFESKTKEDVRLLLDREELDLTLYSFLSI